MSESPRLLTYRHVWTHRNRDGDWEYQYYCTWSDGVDGLTPNLPWGRMEGAVELPMTDLRESPHLGVTPWNFVA